MAQWHRPPTLEEMRNLLDSKIREEVLSREAATLGLDKDDTVIRRRLRQKLEFVSDDSVARTEPTDADLRDYLQSHPESFRVDQSSILAKISAMWEERGERF
jgi:hypothetical protein